MGFISSLFTGTPDQFKATDPTQGPQGDYAAAIAQAQQQALAANGQSNDTAGQQAALAQALMAQANGQGPSLAQQQLQQATQANTAQAAGAIASQRGLNPALAARLISQQQANANQQAAGQSAGLRLEEQLGARQQLGQALAAQRGQDIGQIGANTGVFGAAGQLQGGQNALSQQGQLATQNINAGVAAQNAQFQGQVIGGLLGGIGAFSGHAAMGGGTPGGASAGGSSGAAAAAVPAAHGAIVPGHAQVQGDSPANDTVSAKLSPGEIVIPRSVAQSDDAPARAAAFVEAIKAKDSGGAGGEGYGKLLAKQRELHERLKRIEMLFGGGQAGGR